MLPGDRVVLDAATELLARGRGVWPTCRDIAERSGRSRRQVECSLKRLFKLGYLVRPEGQRSLALTDRARRTEALSTVLERLEPSDGQG